MAQSSSQPIIRRGSPFRESSDALSHCSRRSQDVHKKGIKQEYTGKVYRSDRIFDKIYKTHLSDRQIKLVTVECLKYFRDPLPEESNEQSHYKHFATLLNNIKDGLTKYGFMDQSIYADVRFEMYDRKVKEGVANDASLKPDLVARIPTTSEKVTWEEVELCVEVNGNWPEMVAQGGSYARSIFSSQRSRRFVLVIFYNHKQCSASFGVFSPAWLCLSKTVYDFKTALGQEEFIGSMARIWSCTDRWEAGFELTSNNNKCYFINHGTFYYTKSICFRPSFSGRRTRVDLVSSEDPSKSVLQNGYALRQIPDETEYRNSSQMSEARSDGSSSGISSLRRSSRLFNPFISISPDPTKHIPCNLPVPTCRASHAHLIIKDSWPLASRQDLEFQVFNSVQGEFGVPDIINVYPVRNFDGAVSDTASIFPPDAESYPLWKVTRDASSSRYRTSSQSRPNQGPTHIVEQVTPEERVHMQLLIATQGEVLETAKGPRELLQAILHAMLGYWVLFKNDWLHRDVSVGNVLLMSKPEERKPITDFGDILTSRIRKKYFAKCVGFICDADLTVNWAQVDREHAKQRSGTPPFMSCAQLRAVKSGAEVYHTALDDLESFLWVFFWAVLSSLKSRSASLTRTEEHYWSVLSSIDLDVLLQKRTFHDNLIDQDGNFPCSSAFHPFLPLLTEWCKLSFSEEARRAKPFAHPIDDHRRLVEKWVGTYLEIGLRHLENLPENWDYLEKGVPAPPPPRVRWVHNYGLLAVGVLLLGVLSHLYNKHSRI